MSLYSRLDRLAADQDRLERKFDALANTPQAQRISVEGGSIDFNDSDGNLKAIVGAQDDGGTTVNVVAGPTPPTPSGFTVDVDHGKFITHWTGDFTTGGVAPSDWSRAEVHASPGPFFVPDRTTARGSIVAASGGEVTIGVLKGPWTVKMVSWSQAGKMSLPSQPVDVEVPGYGEIVLEEIDAARTLIKNAGEMLIEGQKTLDEKLAEAIAGGLDPEQIADDIATARQEAIDAAFAEITAVEGTLSSMIGGKTATKWSTSNPPAVYDGAVDDSWIKLTSLGSGGREIERFCWNGNVWVTHKVDGAVLSNVDASTITAGFLDVVNRIRAGAILADKLLIGGERNLIPNGDLSKGSSVGWPTRFTYQTTDVPEGSTGAVNIDGLSTTPMGFGPFPVVPGEVVVFEAWVKADKPDSRIYQESRDQTGNHVGRIGYRWTSVEGGGPLGSYAYPIASYVVPTSWTKLVSRVTVAPGVTSISIGTFYPNHSAGSERTATISLSGYKLYKAVGGTLIEPGGIQTPHLAADVLEVGNLKAGTAALAEAVIAKLFAEVVVAKMVQAEEFIGENAILTGAVTASKITASEELWAKLGQFVKVRAEMVESDVFDGRVFRGSTFLTTNDSRWSDAGLFLNDADGDPRFQAPTDGSDFTVNAEMIAKSLTATGRASFLSENNRLEPGARLVLAAGVGDPPSPPVVSTYYPTIKAPLQDTDRGAYGLALADGHFWRWVENEASDWSTAGSNRGRLEKISTGGDVVAAFDTGDFLARNGAVGIGTELFLLGPKTGTNDRRWVQVYGTDGIPKRQWEYAEYGSGTYQPGIGRDEEGKLLIAQCGGTGYYRHRVYSTTGALLSVFDGNDRTNSDINGIYVGAADFGTRRIIVSKRSGTGRFRQFPVFNTVNGDYVGNQSWYSPGQEEARGVVWDSAKFHSIDTTGVISEFSTLSTGGDGLTSDWWAVYRWAKDVDADLTIDLSSRISPPARFSWPRRARLRITAPNLPQGAEEIAPSLALKTTVPSRADFHTPAWWSNAGEPTAYYYELSGDWQSANSPGDSNNFPNGVPSALTASSGLFEVKGDGSGRWGPLTFNPDGTMSSSAVPVWVPVTTFTSGYGPNTFGFAPAYRLWPDGKVEWRGNVAGTLSANADILTVPAVVRPAQAVNLPVASNNSGSRLRRAEFLSSAAPTMLRVYSGEGAGTWVSLDGISYYKD